MNVEEFLDQYDIQEGDLLECENGEVYELQYVEEDLNNMIISGPKPKCGRRYLSVWGANSKSKAPFAAKVGLFDYST